MVGTFAILGHLAKRTEAVIKVSLPHCNMSLDTTSLKIEPFMSSKVSRRQSQEHSILAI
jgi:hypothetical protein